MTEKKPNYRAMLMKRDEFLSNIIAKGMEDGGFREELLKNPKAVIEKEIGKKLPERFQVKALEETADTAYIVVPRKLPEALDEAELTDEALKKAVGGMFVVYRSSSGTFIHWIDD